MVGRVKPAETRCPCVSCAADPTTSLARGHASLRALAAYVPAHHRAALAAHVDQRALWGQEDDDTLSRVLDVAVSDIHVHRHHEWDSGAWAESQLDDLAVDRPTRERLREAWRRRLDWRTGPASTAAHPVELNVRAHGRQLSVTCPDTVESYLVLFEVFLSGCYRGVSGVPGIYDLGAHVGMAALWFHSLLPRAEVVCVEPLRENLAYLEENLRRNRVPSRVVPAAVSDHDGEMTLHACGAMTGLSGVAPLRHVAGTGWAGLVFEPRVVPCVDAGVLVRGLGYGLKVDIEGSEHALAARPRVFTDAAWVVGELHLGPSVVPLERAGDLVAVLERAFDVTLDGPGTLGDTVTYLVRAWRPGRHVREP
jgi:FkbM family methyltransferase